MDAPWLKIAGVILIASVAYLWVQNMAESSESEAWTQLARARNPEFTTESLENIRGAVAGSSAEPWADFYLAMLLYDQNEDLDRARQIASQAVAGRPDHPTTAMLSRLIEALDSYPDAN